MVAAGTLRPKLRKAKADGWARWVRTPSDERAVYEGCVFDEGRANHVREFFDRWLRHSKGEWGGKPFDLLDWQWVDLIAPIFGWIRADGFRRIQKSYCEIPKKNGKSTLGAGVGIYMLIGDGEPGAEVYSAATKRDQAAIVHGEATNMVRSSLQLFKRLRINESTKTITHTQSRSKYAALSADAKGSEGLNTHCLIIDELHAWKDRAFWDSLRYGYAARRQPLTFIITTAGVCDKESLCWREHSYAERWLAGEVEDTEYHAYVRAADSEDDITDPAVHEASNPSYGVIISPREIAKAAADAEEKPSELFSFMRYRLNIWTDSAIQWIRMDKWDACETAIDLAKLEGRPCYAGLDLATTTDTTALVLVFPDADGSFDVVPYFWVPEEKARERSKRDGVGYVEWERSGFIEFTPGNVTDYGFIRARLNELGERFDIREIAFDPWNATQLATQLGEEDGFEMVKFRQGYVSMSEPSKALERLYLSGNLRHDGHPVLRTHMKNACIRTDPAGNIKPDKEKSTERIDGAVGTIMALGIALVHQNDFVYNDRGIQAI